jgi:hypothetical protein
MCAAAFDTASSAKFFAPVWSSAPSPARRQKKILNLHFSRLSRPYNSTFKNALETGGKFQ